MAKHLQRDLDHLKHEILAVGTLVEEAIAAQQKAVAEAQKRLMAVPKHWSKSKRVAIRGSSLISSIRVP